MISLREKIKSFRYRGIEIKPLALLAIVAVSVTGAVLISAISAAIHVVSVEAEDGSRTGNAELVFALDNPASGQGHVMFGGGMTPSPPPPPPTPPTPPGSVPTPSGLQAWTGGNSIVLQWTPNTAAPSTNRYEVYRNGTKIGTTTPNPNAAGELYGAVYIDKSVTKGATYSYAVRAINADGTLSPPSATLSATHPSSGIGVPTITVDPLVAQVDPGLDNWYRTVGIPMLQTWYPKIGQQLAYPSYTPWSNITLSTMSDWFTGVDAIVHENEPTRILMRPGIQQNPTRAGGTLVHESVHVMQHNKFGYSPSWIPEGIADYARYAMLNADSQASDNRFRYANAVSDKHFVYSPYQAGSILFDYIQRKVDSTYVRRVMTAKYNGTINASLLQFSNGRDINQVWAESQGATSRTGSLKTKANASKCLDIPNGTMTAGTQAQLWDCNGNIAQKLTVHDMKDGTVGLIMLGYCLEVFGRQNANGTPVGIYHCTGDLGGKWTVKTDGSLMINLPGNKCLDAANGSIANSTKLQLWDCNGSNAQRWTLP